MVPQVRAWVGGGVNIKQLVTNDETKFKILTFWTCQKIVQLTVSQLGTIRKIQIVERNFNGTPATAYSCHWEKLFRLGQVKSKFALIQFGK